MSASVLVVDDEPVFRLLVEEALAAEQLEVRTAENLRQARAEVDNGAPDILILDRRLPDGDGIDFLKKLRETESSSMIILVLTAYGDVQNAVEALKAGASDYLTKPVQLTDLIVKLRKVLEARGLRDRLAIARSSNASPPTVESRSPAMKELEQNLRRVSQSPLTPVFVRGPSGAGKQRMAEILHGLTWAADSDAPFVELNCAALPDDLVESELFGHEKGAFTDAKATRRGLIEMAAGGTLFLDEITELPLRSQAKLLKFLDTMRFRRVGGQREIPVELRIVAAANQDVEALVQDGRFREDLYHRLAVFVLTIPPLAAHRQDVPELARTFAEFFARRLGKPRLVLSPDALRVLAEYDFPGNVRELRNIIEHAVILSTGPEIRAADIVLPARDMPRRADSFFSMTLDAQGAPPAIDIVERAYVARVLEHCGGHRSAAAQTLGISYPTFLKRLRELGLDAERRADKTDR
jgi:two-component system response regulator AtoC